MMHQGILPVCKPSAMNAFRLVTLLRKLTSIRTIGHAGTLDPFASGVMLLLIGKPFTRLSSQFLHQDKEYHATLRLGVTTDTYDLDGEVTGKSDKIPSLQEVEQALVHFQGNTLQTPPMFSAKKIGGQKLYNLARQGITIERLPCPVTMRITLQGYTYPTLSLHVHCSKGTYIRSLAYDLGAALSCGAHLTALVRTRSGSVALEECCEGARLMEPGYNWASFLKQEIPHAPALHL